MACAGAVLVSMGTATAGRGLPARPDATCSAAKKAQRQRAVAAYKKQMARARSAYFYRHRSQRLRKAFVKRQQARLRALRRAARCTVVAPSPAPPPAPSPLADLSLGMTASAGSIGIHATVAYTLVVTNRGDAPARGVEVSDTLPDGLELAGLSPGCSGLVAIRCDLGDLGPGASQTVRVAARAMQVGQLANGAGTSSASQDASAGNDTASVTVSVAPLPQYVTPPGPGFSFQLSRPAFADDATYSTYPWVGEWPKTPGVFANSTGTFRGAVLFVDFPDADGAQSTVSQEDAMRLLRSTAPSWYEEASYGRLHFELTAVNPPNRWYRMSKPVADYGIAQCCSLPNVRAFVEEAIAKANPEVDFSGYDALWVIGPYEASAQMTILVDQRWPGAGITVDGHELRRWISAPAAYPSVPTQIDPAIFSNWIVTHESGHLLGLPDLYLKPPGCPTCVNTFEPVGYWDLMSDVPLHAHFLAWHKWLLGWLDSSQLRGLSGPGQVIADLAPLAAPGGVKAVVVPLTASTAYVVEARAPLGWESGLCDHGVLVYTVDSTKRNAEGPVSIKPAHASSTQTACGPIAEAAYDVGPDEISTYDDAAAGVKVEVLAHNADGSYHVRVTKS